MIGFLKGCILGKEPGRLLVLIQSGVAYWLTISKNKLHHYSLGDGVCFFIADVTSSQGDQTLFAFDSSLEYFWFHTLIKIPGLGGKTAQNILSFYDPKALYGLLWEENFVLLQRVDGIGLKMAQRIVQELKEKLSSIAKDLHNLEEMEKKQQDIIKNTIDCSLEKTYITEKQNNSLPDSLQETIKFPKSLREKKQQWACDYEKSKTLALLEKNVLDILENLGYSKEASFQALKNYIQNEYSKNDVLPDISEIIAYTTKMLCQQE